MSDCLDCKKKVKEISILKGTVEFHKGEQESWRKLFNEQRGGDTFNLIQSQLGDERAENARLRMQIKQQPTEEGKK